MNKGTEEKILELKKEKLVKTLRKFFVEKKIKRAINNPNSQYRSIYLSYNNWRKKNPKDFPSPRLLWKERDFRDKKNKILNGK